MEKAILVGLDTHSSDDFSESMAELAKLAEACDIDVVQVTTQKAEQPTANFYIGQGKVEGLKRDILTLDANLVIFNDELSPSHIRNLEKALETKIIDRTVLILDIFARRAKTKEAMLQVELAQSLYLLPRVIGMYRSLSRQKSGTGSKGPGEQQLEIDRRLLRDRISRLKTELRDVVEIRRTQRRKRQQSAIKTVAIAGYTNSGKSTLMNALLQHSSKKADKYMFEKNMLFATLETQTREITLENNHHFLLTDTVGFISKLPHHLIEAFKSTLEEIKESSLILHVIDAANPHYLQQIEVAEAVLKEIGVENIPIIHVFNKIDQCNHLPIEEYPHTVHVSALNDLNIDLLLDVTDRLLYPNRHVVRMLIPFSQGQLYNYLQKNTHIQETVFSNDGVSLLVELDDLLMAKYAMYIL
jgi:GTP-binding protein HflX